MAIKHATKSSPKKNEEQQKNAGFNIIFFALNILLVPFSAYATFAGYKEFLELPMAILLAAVTGLLFFGLNYFISDKRIKGEPHLHLVLGYCIPLFISFFGNFSYFYGGQMEGVLLDKDLTAHRTVLTKTYNDAIGGLNKEEQRQIDSVRTKNELGALESALDSKLGVLSAQIADGGYGPRARRKWEEIRLLFEDYNREKLGNSGKPLTSVYTPTYSNFETVVNSQFAGLQQREDREIQDIRVSIQAQKDRIDNTTDYNELVALTDTLLQPANADRLVVEGVLLIKNIIATNDQIGQYAATVITPFNYEVLDFYNPVNRRNFSGVLENAFITVEKASATFISTVLSLVIDLATIGFVLLILSYHRKKKMAPSKLTLRGPQKI